MHALAQIWTGRQLVEGLPALIHARHVLILLVWPGRFAKHWILWGIPAEAYTCIYMQVIPGNISKCMDEQKDGATWHLSENSYASPEIAFFLCPLPPRPPACQRVCKWLDDGLRRLLLR